MNQYNPWRFEPALLFGLAVIAVQAWGYLHGWTADKVMTVTGFVATAGALVTRSSSISVSTVHKAGMTVPELTAMAADPSVPTVEQKSEALEQRNKPA